MYSFSSTSSNDPAARLAREQSAPVISGGRLRRTDTIPSGLLANASRKCRSRSDQFPGEKSGRYSFRISRMSKEPTFLEGLFGSAIPLVIALLLFPIGVFLIYIFWFGIDWIMDWLF